MTNTCKEGEEDKTERREGEKKAKNMITPDGTTDMLERVNLKNFTWNLCIFLNRYCRLAAVHFEIVSSETDSDPERYENHQRIYLLWMFVA